MNDTDRLRKLVAWEAIEGFVGVDKDIYEFASQVAEERGRDEPDSEDMLEGLRRLIDEAASK